MTENTPKVFISYSWTSAERVIELAQRLMGDGVEVVLDKWELKEGQDKYAFMERSVADPSIGRVLMICDKAYAEKANDRKGGVGDETQVISPEVYEKTQETKYIPVIFERNENGTGYVPAYLKSRIYIDLCAENDNYEQEYEKLLRNLHGKPEYSKPVLGKMPEWLNEEKVDLSGVRNLLKQVQAYDGKSRSKTEFAVQKFNDEYIQAIYSFFPEQGDDFDKKLLAQIDIAKPLRDIFFDYVETIIMNDMDIGSVISDFFEQVYNGIYLIEGRNSYTEEEFDFPNFLIWEMFVGATAILLHYEKYIELNAILKRTYFLRKDPLGDSIAPATFIKFSPYFKYIDGHIKLNSDNPRLYTLAGDIAVKREKVPIIKQATLANADLVLYQLSCIYDFSDKQYHRYWFPRLYIYAVKFHSVNQQIWSKMVSSRHCKKLFPLFGVTSIDQLKMMVAKNRQDDRVQYPGAWDSAASIMQSIELEKIGTMP